MEELRGAISTASPIDAAPADDCAPSLLLYTSGTSGRSKGVMLSERNAFFTGVNFALAAHVERQSTLLCDAPMFHVIGLVIGLRAILQQGAAILVSDGFEPATTNLRIGDPSLAVTHYFCVPQMAAALRAAKNFEAWRLARLTALVVGGAPIDEDSVRSWLDDGIMLANGFGMTEIGAGAAMPLDLSIIRARPMSAGVFPPTQQARVVAPDGRDAAVGTPGEIWVKGPNVSGGYWNRPDETASAFTAEGWFKTGDIGFIDAGGYLTVIDRKKDMFISGGENVYPAEVEKVLKMCPGVAEAAVFGTADPRWGEVGYACVVPEGEPELTSDGLRLFCTERLAGYKVPKYFVLVNELPRTGSGKVLKHVLRRQVAEGRTGLLRVTLRS
jgi:fatty-acyl-CoA synthase